MKAIFGIINSSKNWKNYPKSSRIIFPVFSSFFGRFFFRDLLTFSHWSSQNPQLLLYYLYKHCRKMPWKTLHSRPQMQCSAFRFLIYRGHVSNIKIHLLWLWWEVLLAVLPSVHSDLFLRISFGKWLASGLWHQK